MIKDTKGNEYKLVALEKNCAFVTKKGGEAVMIARQINGVLVEKPVYLKGIK